MLYTDMEKLLGILLEIGLQVCDPQATRSDVASYAKDRSYRRGWPDRKCCFDFLGPTFCLFFSALEAATVILCFRIIFLLIGLGNDLLHILDHSLLRPL